MDTKQNIKALLFDFAGVLGAEWKWIWDNQEPENFSSIKQKMFDQVDKGEITTAELIKKISQIAGIPESRVWPEIFPQIKINWELVRYIEVLRKRYKIGLLSNYNHDFLEEVFHKHDLSKYFDAIYISSRYKMIKPELGAFEKAIELLGVGKEEVIFIDDRQIHVDASKKYNIQSILYTSVKQLRGDLKNIGVQV